MICLKTDTVFDKRVSVIRFCSEAFVVFKYLNITVSCISNIYVCHVEHLCVNRF